MNKKRKTIFIWAVKIILIITAHITNVLADVGMAQKLYIERSLDPNINELIANELIRSKYYFSASFFAKEHIYKSDSISPQFEKSLERLVIKTGTATFSPLSEVLLGKHKSPTLSFVLGLKLLKRKNFKKAFSYLMLVPKDHRFSAEASMMRGVALSMMGKKDVRKSLKEYSQCIKLSSQHESNAKNKKLARYHTYLKESCIIHQARIVYQKDSFIKSIKGYETIPKTAYMWPYLLLEKAWANYYLKDYNRTLGLLVTYRSPLLNSYFFPEAEVLSALSYLKLCLWGDAQKTIDQYYKVYKPRSDKLKKMLLDNRKSNSYFLKIMFSSIESEEKKNPFLRNLITQIRKKVKFSLDLVVYKKLQNELRYVNKMKKSDFSHKLLKGIQVELAWRTKLLNHYVKRYMFRFINDIHRYSYEMFNIELEIMSKKRNLVYENRELISDRSRGSLKNVNRKIDQHFWSFTGEFWADELGDYSFGLKSNCEKVSVKRVALRRRRR